MFTTSVYWLDFSTLMITTDEITNKRSRSHNRRKMHFLLRVGSIGRVNKVKINTKAVFELNGAINRCAHLNAVSNGLWTDTTVNFNVQFMILFAECFHLDENKSWKLLQIKWSLQAPLSCIIDHVPRIKQASWSNLSALSWKWKQN